jgi:UDP-glucose 4-epimerase
MDTDWRQALGTCQVVVHLAARVHQIHESSHDAIRAYREMNVDVTVNLARQAADAGLRRFVFVSSVKVNGESSGRHPFAATDTPNPQDPYGQSKWEAEQRLQELGSNSGMEIVIVRPPLVYGPGVSANFLRLMQLIRSGMPLPFGMIRNKRSLVGLDNLVDFLILCTSHPAVAGKVWMVSDQHDISIGELSRVIAAAMGKPARLLPIPPALLRVTAILMGKRDVATRLLDALQVDTTPANELLGWKPPVLLEEGIQRTVRHFLDCST